MTRFSLSKFVEIAQSVGIVVSIALSYNAIVIQKKEIADKKKIASERLVLSISDRLNDPKYSMIIDAIQHKSSSHSLHGFKRFNLDEYLDNFDMMGDMAHDGLLTRAMVYDEFRYDIEKAWCNVTVQKYIHHLRKGDGVRSGDGAYYSGFQSIAIYSLKQDRKDCAQMDGE